MGIFGFIIGRGARTLDTVSNISPMSSPSALAPRILVFGSSDVPSYTRLGILLPISQKTFWNFCGGEGGRLNNRPSALRADVEPVDPPPLQISESATFCSMCISAPLIISRIIVRWGDSQRERSSLPRKISRPKPPKPLAPSAA